MSKLKRATMIILTSVLCGSLIGCRTIEDSPFSERTDDTLATDTVLVESQEESQYKLAISVEGVPEAACFSDSGLSSFSFPIPEIESVTFRHEEKEETLSETNPQIILLLNFIFDSEEKGLTAWPERDPEELINEITMLRAAEWSEVEVCFSAENHTMEGPFSQMERLCIIRDRCFLYRGTEPSLVSFFPYDKCYSNYLEQSGQTYLDRYRIPDSWLAYESSEPWIDLLRYTGIQPQPHSRTSRSQISDLPIAFNPGNAECCPIILNGEKLPEKAYIGVYEGVEYYELPFLAILRGAGVVPQKTSSGYDFSINGRSYHLYQDSNGASLYVDGQEDKELNLFLLPPGSAMHTSIIFFTDEEVYIDDQTVLLFLQMQQAEYVRTSHDGVAISIVTKTD